MRSNKYDENIKLWELIKYKCRNITMLIRGKSKFLFRKNLKIYFGKNVKLLNKNRLHFGKNIRINDYVEIDALTKEHIIIGDNASIGKFTIMRGCTSCEKIGKGIKIGDNFSCGDFCFFGPAGGIEIGNDVMMGQNVRFHAQNHNYKEDKIIRNQGVTNKGIKIGNNCWIGSGSVFLDGVTIGNGCVIGANSVVTKNFPDNSVIVGTPARKIKDRIENRNV